MPTDVAGSAAIDIGGAPVSHGGIVRLFVTLLAVLTLAAPASAEPWGPWERADEDGPSPHRGERIQESGTNAHVAFALLLRAYQLTLSGQDSVRCPMFPSCSRFAMEAYQRYGPIAGTLMTADRLLRDHGQGHERYARIRVGDRVLLHDPPEAHAPW